jgi:hypothetical protein
VRTAARGVGCELLLASPRPPRSELGPAVILLELRWSYLVDRSRFEQGEPEVRHAQQETLKLGLVAHCAREMGVAAGTRERHPLERKRHAVAELAFDDQPIAAFRHASEGCTFERALTRRAGLSPG